MGNLRATPLCALFLRPWPSERNLETVTNLNASRRECFNSFCWRKKGDRFVLLLSISSREVIVKAKVINCQKRSAQSYIMKNHILLMINSSMGSNVLTESFSGGFVNEV